MNQHREYEIAFVGLKPGVHVYDYRINDQFFALYGAQDFSNCEANVKLSLERNSGFMQLKFDISGDVDVVCDKCGNPLNKQLWDEFNVIVKLVDEPELMNEQEEDPDIYYIGRNESHLMVSDWIFEFINLSLPMQKRCNLEELGGPLCNKKVLEQLKQMEIDVMKDINPQWKGLEKFKDLE